MQNRGTNYGLRPNQIGFFGPFHWISFKLRSFGTSWALYKSRFLLKNDVANHRADVVPPTFERIEVGERREANWNPHHHASWRAQHEAPKVIDR